MHRYPSVIIQVITKDDIYCGMSGRYQRREKQGFPTWWSATGSGEIWWEGREETFDRNAKGAL